MKRTDVPWIAALLSGALLLAGCPQQPAEKVRPVEATVEAAQPAPATEPATAPTEAPAALKEVTLQITGMT